MHASPNIPSFFWIWLMIVEQVCSDGRRQSTWLKPVTQLLKNTKLSTCDCFIEDPDRWLLDIYKRYITPICDHMKKEASSYLHYIWDEQYRTLGEKQPSILNLKDICQVPCEEIIIHSTAVCTDDSPPPISSSATFSTKAPVYSLTPLPLKT